MDERFYLQKAQEAEAIANAALSEIQRHQWEEIAKQYRLLIVEAAKLRGLPQEDSGEHSVTSSNLGRAPKGQ